MKHPQPGQTKNVKSWTEVDVVYLKDITGTIYGIYDGKKGDIKKIKNWGFYYRGWPVADDGSYYENDERNHEKTIVVCSGQGYWTRFIIGEDVEILK